MEEVPQDEERATYAARLTKADSPIDWGWPAVRIHNLVRGLHPWPRASTLLGDRRIIVLQTTPVATAHAVPPGTVCDGDGARLVIVSGSGDLQILRLQLEGKRPMTGREFLAGHHLQAGDRFGA